MIKVFVDDVIKYTIAAPTVLTSNLMCADRGVSLLCTFCHFLRKPLKNTVFHTAGLHFLECFHFDVWGCQQWSPGIKSNLLNAENINTESVSLCDRSIITATSNYAQNFRFHF